MVEKKGHPLKIGHPFRPQAAGVGSRATGYRAQASARARCKTGTAFGTPWSDATRRLPRLHLFRDRIGSSATAVVPPVASPLACGVCSGCRALARYNLQRPVHTWTCCKTSWTRALSDAAASPRWAGAYVAPALVW